jgi:glycogen debranching enzyme
MGERRVELANSSRALLECTVVGLEELDPLLSDEGWPYASALPVEPGDPGRFHALFGRDSLITSLQVLPVRPEVARATLRALARLQGTRHDPETEEEPGKIGHEFREALPAPFGEAGYRPASRNGFRYYGSADATAWWLIVLAATGDRTLAAELEPARQAAAAWIEGALERGGGYVRHGAGAPRGSLSQQGWRDAIDPSAPAGHGGGILRPDGSAPQPPLADADTQAIAHAALRALAALSREDRWARRADELAERIEADFGPEIIALEGDGKPVPGAGTQLGWLLWAGAVRGAVADALAERLAQPDLLTPYGLRTLSSAHPRFDPHAYHRGSVWPFDSWIAWGGLRAAGRADEAEAVRSGVLRALDSFTGAPECYAVTPAGELEQIEIANRVQAWTVGARWALHARWDGRRVAHEPD